MCGVRHHCIDIASPRRTVSAAQWVTCAEKAVEVIAKKHKLPIIAGGTGFYIDALVYGTDFPAVKPNATLRKTLEKKGAQELLAILKKLDPARAKTVEQKNPRRLIRAIEIATALGKVPTLKKRTPRYDVTWIGLDPGPTELETRIENRLKKTLKRGLVAETKQIKESGLSWKRINELGLEYRIVAAFLRDEIDKATLEKLLVQELKQYVRRQRTWFKRDKEIHWFTSPDQALSEFPEIRSRRQ
jgi:tRNA dimethylallyltransferase